MVFDYSVYAFLLIKILAYSSINNIFLQHKPIF